MKYSKIYIHGNTVTPDDVEEAILKETYIKLGAKILICHLTLTNGFECTGQAGVVDPEKFDMEIGSDIARKDALGDVWFHLGSILQNKLCAK